MIWHPVTTTLLVHFSWGKKMLWLSIRKCIKYKVACMCFNAINGSGPAYLSELLHVYTPSRTLRSSSDTHMLKLQQDSWLSHFLLLCTPHLENTTETCLMINFLNLLFFVRSFSEPTISQISSSKTELYCRLDDAIAKLSISELFADKPTINCQ